MIATDPHGEDYDTDDVRHWLRDEERQEHDPDDCMNCGQCEWCIERSIACAEEMEKAQMKYSDDNEPITKEWFKRISIRCGEHDTDDYAVVISVDERTSIMNCDEEVTVLGYSFKDQLAYIETYGGDDDPKSTTNTQDLILLGVRKTRGEFRLLLRALNAWDSETWDERHPKEQR